MFPLPALAELTGDYTLDADRSRLGFVARHAMSTRVRGQFTEFDGTAHLDGADPSASFVRLTVAASSLRTGNRRRDDQLCQAFLATDEHPSLRFASTEVRQRSATRFAVTGGLTIRGVTRPITLDLELAEAMDDLAGEPRVSLTGTAVVDRHDWGVNWNTATRLMVSPKVALELDVTAVR